MICVFSLVVKPGMRNFDVEVTFNMERQGQSTSKTVEISTEVLCISGPILVILAWIGDWYWDKFELEHRSQSPHKTIAILIKLFYTSDPNLVILNWTGNALSRGQAHDQHKHTHTDRRR